MTLGQKIRTERKKKKLTQNDLCKDRITRNMLSSIENDKASPSLETLRFIALSLEVPISYLVSEDEDIFFYKKSEKINLIREHFGAARYKKCIDAALSLGEIDDEIAYILSVSYFELGKQAVLDGSLSSALKHFDYFNLYSDKTVYTIDKAKVLATFYSAIAKNVKAPMLELDTNYFENSLKGQYDLEFYNFIKNNYSYPYTDPILSNHIKAKAYMKEFKYNHALTLLHEIEATKSKKNYNAYLVLNLYTDIEYCYKQIADFENAYKYSTKRMTLMEQFDS